MQLDCINGFLRMDAIRATLWKGKGRVDVRRVDVRRDVWRWRNSSKILSLTKVKYNAQHCSGNGGMKEGDHQGKKKLLQSMTIYCDASDFEMRP